MLILLTGSTWPSCRTKQKQVVNCARNFRPFWSQFGVTGRERGPAPRAGSSSLDPVKCANRGDHAPMRKRRLGAPSHPCIKIGVRLIEKRLEGIKRGSVEPIGHAIDIGAKDQVHLPGASSPTAKAKPLQLILAWRLRHPGIPSRASGRPKRSFI